MKKVSILCDNPIHPVFSVLNTWCEKNRTNYDLELVSDVRQLRADGDYLFLVSCSNIVDKTIRDRFRYAMVLHASDLPKGRGWSPHIWEILEGATFLTLSLLEAGEEVDSGRIFLSKHIPINADELYDEINEKLFAAELELIEKMLERGEDIKPKTQSETASYYRKRVPSDSKLNVDKSLREQFNLLRVCDPDRFPAFFELNGHRYSLNIEKVRKLEDEE